MADRSPLDDLPLDVLLALQEALADPTAVGVERARQRAAEAGYGLDCANPPDPAAPPRGEPPLPGPEAPPEHGGVELDLAPDTEA